MMPKHKMEDRVKRKYFSWRRNDLSELKTGSLRGVLSAFSSLSVRNFRLYFIGQCFSLCGR